MDTNFLVREKREMTRKGFEEFSRHFACFAGRLFLFVFTRVHSWLNQSQQTYLGAAIETQPMHVSDAFGDVEPAIFPRI